VARLKQRKRWPEAGLKMPRRRLNLKQHHAIQVAADGQQGRGGKGIGEFDLEPAERHKELVCKMVMLSSQLCAQQTTSTSAMSLTGPR
jgi:hypothetical protein